MNQHEREAYDLGVKHAKSAASWVIDGNTPQDHIVRMVGWLDDGDPRVDDYLPRTPNLSGEMADDPTPSSLADDILGPVVDTEDRLIAHDPYVEREHATEALSDAYEAGVMDAFMPECERILRAAALSTHEL